MSFDTYFRVSSYATIVVAAVALALAGGLNLWLISAFAAVVVLSWKLEGSKWQVSERAGLVIVLLSVPLFFLDWKLQQALGESSGRRGVNALAHLIVFLSAIKLLQVKADRDWVFLYLISFFELLLAAGLSFSPVFLISLSLYLLFALSTVIAFEIRKARRAFKTTETRLLVPPDSRVFRSSRRVKQGSHFEATRLPLTAFGLLVFIFILALPLFLVAPRAGSSVISRGGPGLGSFIGFSDNVALGELGTLKENDQVVMRVRVEEQDSRNRGLRWRGVALDEFTGRGWRKSSEARSLRSAALERGSFRVDTVVEPYRLTTQTIFLEPLETPVLFAAPRVVAVQGDFPFVRIDNEGSIQSRSHESDRFIYKALSDTSEPPANVLRNDLRPYPTTTARYLALPEKLDPRIGALARGYILDARADNRYDAARAIERRLQTDYSYTLERKASGADPLSDFLFSVRAGHCEYFSTAMAVMLRTRGIAARVVNGFLPGEYNDAAGAYTVRQSDAHSWVEVYFPESNSWVTFDPTPAAGRTEPQRTGVTALLGKYAEALELVWFQYVVGYDQQEQRSLATALHNRLFQYQHGLARVVDIARTKAWGAWLQFSITLAATVTLALLVFLAFRIRRLGWRGLFPGRKQYEGSAVEFYERLTRLLANRGIVRSPDQTPLEFAAAIGQDVPLRVTQAYHRVRYGAESLSARERDQIERWLLELEQTSS